MFSCISGMGQNLFKKEGLTPDFKHLWMPGSNSEKSAFQVRIWNAQRFVGHLDLSFGVVFAETPVDNREYTIPPGANYNYIQTGFFCRKEWELEKATHIPFRFRLGSLAEMDAMEGKH
jgi:hypothetical protein